VPPEPVKTVYLHTVPRQSLSAGESVPETGRLPPRRRAFGSLRVDGEVPVQAKQLQDAMRAEGAGLNLIDMTAGGDIDLAMQEGILAADTFIVFGSAKYGEDTGNAAYMSPATAY
jgi:hypothetical protein